MNFPTTFFGWVAFLAEKYGPDFMRGLGVTLQLATIGTVLGCVLGFVVGMVRSVDIDKHSSVVSQTILRILKAIIAVYVEVIRGTPLMVQATVIYYGTMSIWGLDIPSFSAGILALSLHIGAYFSESVRGAIGGIDKGQMEGGQAIGMSYLQIMLHVIIPQAFRNLIPQIGNTFISDVLSGWFGIGGVGGFVGNFLMGFLPAILVRNPKKWWSISIWCAVASVACAVCIGGWQEIMNINKFVPMFIAICACNTPINVILTPIAVKLLLPRVQKRGLYWKEVEEDDAKASETTSKA